MAAGGVARHGVNAAVSGAGSGADYGDRLGREAIDPFIGGDGLAGVGIGPEGRPIPFLLDLFVGNRTFHHQHERIEPALLGVDTRYFRKSPPHS